MRRHAPRYLTVGQWMDEAAHESLTARHRLWWLMAGLALLAALLTSMS